MACEGLVSHGLGDVELGVGTIPKRCQSVRRLSLCDNFSTWHRNINLDDGAILLLTGHSHLVDARRAYDPEGYVGVDHTAFGPLERCVVVDDLPEKL